MSQGSHGGSRRPGTKRSQGSSENPHSNGGSILFEGLVAVAFSDFLLQVYGKLRTAILNAHY